ncbi:MAG: DUF1153 domain-containing protein [Rhodobacterales bacterium]
MYVKRNKGPNFVTLPDGRKLTRSDLPPVSTKRWVASRKACVILAVETGLIKKQEACEMYAISQEEFNGWLNAVKSHGISALKTTKLQDYRQP